MNLKRILSSALLMVTINSIAALAQSSAKSEFIVCQSDIRVMCLRAVQTDQGTRDYPAVLVYL